MVNFIGGKSFGWYERLLGVPLVESILFPPKLLTPAVYVSPFTHFTLEPRLRRTDARSSLQDLEGSVVMTGKDGPPRRGRPRSVAAQSAVLDTTYEMISREGLAATTIDAIARQSSVSKVTIYKWWPSREALLIDAFLRQASKMLAWNDSSDARTAVRSHAASYAAALVSEFGAVQLSVISDCVAKTGSARLFSERYLNVRRAIGVQTIERGQREGTITATRSAADLYDQIYGTLFYRFVFGLKPLSPDYARKLADSVLHPT